MCGVVVRDLIVHDVPAGHEPNRDEDASDGEEFGVAMHWTSDHRDSVSATGRSFKSRAVRRMSKSLPPTLNRCQERSDAIYRYIRKGRELTIDRTRGEAAGPLLYDLLRGAARDE